MSNQDDALRLCQYIEPLCQKHGFHVALTGGCLYGNAGNINMRFGKDPDIERKDINIIFYSVRQELPEDGWDMSSDVRRASLCKALETELNIIHDSQIGWLNKAHLGEHKIDMMFPEVFEGDYDTGDTA